MFHVQFYLQIYFSRAFDRVEANYNLFRSLYLWLPLPTRAPFFSSMKQNTKVEENCLSASPMSTYESNEGTCMTCVLYMICTSQSAKVSNQASDR